MGDIAQLEKAKRRAESKDDLREVANICNLLGQEYMKDGDFDEAVTQHKQEASLCEALGDTIGVAVANRRLGEVYCEMGQWDKALRYQNRHLSLAKEADSLVEEQRAYATLGRTHLQRAEVFGANGQAKEQLNALAEAERAFLSSLSTCKSLEGSVDMREHNQMRCRLYLNLGLVLESRGNDQEARKLIGQALDLCSSNGLHEDALRCHTALGTILLRIGSLLEALQEGQKSLALAAKLHDKVLQCENHCFIAQVHLANSDFEAAKKCYHKAYKLKHPSLEDRKRIESQLKVVVSLCDAENALILITDSEKDEKLKLYEKLGDGLSKLGLFSKSLKYYHLMLNLATELDKEPAFLAPIYLSLAQTYSDNKEYQKARDYYMKEYEIKIKVDPSDACKTLLSLAITCENKGDDYSTLEVIYSQAADAAVKAKNKKLEYKVLHVQSMLSGIPNHVKEELEERLKALVDSNEFDPDEETSEEEIESEDDIDLELVNFSDSENDQENFDTSRQPRQKKSFVVKRNEKGETALHKASISGNLNMVKRLLKQGHPVNPRDNCGWLPLHEAANHGFCEIVEVLLDAGACINDRGGKFCDGITPIHDAAACGNLQVVRLLMSRGASLIVKTNDGSTPYESLLNYRLRSNLPRSEEMECIKLEEDMKEVMARTGHKIPDSSAKTSRVQSRATDSSNTSRMSSTTERHRSIAARSASREKSTDDWTSDQGSGSRRLSLSDSDDDLPPLGIASRERVSEEPASLNESLTLDDIYDSEEFIVNPLLHDIQGETSSATGTYLNAIGSVGSAVRRAEIHKSSSSWKPTNKDKKVALVSSVEDVGDEWLDDDLGIFSKKRKRTDRFEFEYKEQRKERKVLKEQNSVDRPIIKKKRQTKLTNILQISASADRNSIDTSSTNSGNVEEDRNTLEYNFSNPVVISENSLTHSNYTSQSKGGSIPVISGGSALRLRVRVQNRLLLVPVAGAGQGRTVGWLADEVTRRYYQLAGLRPHLTLTTQDGAVLDSNDPISLVLSSEQAELQAQVTGWDLPPLPERYSQACQALGTVPVPSLTSVLNQAEASTSLNLSRMARLSSQLLPVLRAIQCQQSLHTLIVANCRLGDDGFKFLMEALPSLPSLEVLDLKCSSLTTSSLLLFTDALSSGELALKALASLDFSYNNFAGAKVSDVVALFSLPSLIILSLKHCYFSLTGQQQLPVKASSLKNLALDYNTIYEASLITLLSCIPQISRLSLSGLNCKTDIKIKTRLGVALSSILGAGEECLLEHLDLSSCGLSDPDLEDISAYLYRCPHLTSINLAHNDQLTSSCVNVLLNELTSNIVLPLKALSLHGITSSSDLHAKLASTLQQKATTQNGLTKLSVSQTNNDMLETAWRSQNQQKASIRKIGSEIFLAC